jgi:hypothetical protein
MEFLSRFGMTSRLLLEAFSLLISRQFGTIFGVPGHDLKAVPPLASPNLGFSADLGFVTVRVRRSPCRNYPALPSRGVRAGYRLGSALNLPRTGHLRLAGKWSTIAENLGPLSPLRQCVVRCSLRVRVAGSGPNEKGETMATTTQTPKNPATTKSPATGKRVGPPRKPLPAAGNTTKPTTTGRATTSRKPAAKAPATKQISRETKPAAKKPAAKVAPAGRNLPRDLVTKVAALYKDASPADRQRVANYLKIVTTGTDEQGNRWWPDSSNLPRPTHFSWAKASK